MHIIEKLVDLKAVMLSLLSMSGYFLNGVITQVKQADKDWVEYVIGPAGGLVITVAIFYIVWKYMRHKDDLIKEIRDQQIKDKDKQIEELKERLKKYEN